MQSNKKAKKTSPMTPPPITDNRPIKRRKGNTQQIISSNNNQRSVARNKKHNNNTANTNNTSKNNHSNNTSNNNNGTTTHNTTNSVPNISAQIPRNTTLLRQIPVPNPNPNPNLLALNPPNPPRPAIATTATTVATAMTASEFRVAFKASPNIFTGLHPNALRREYDRMKAKLRADYQQSKPVRHPNSFRMNGISYNNNNNNSYNSNNDWFGMNGDYSNNNVFICDSSRLSFSSQSLAGKGFVGQNTINDDFILTFAVRGQNGTDTHTYNQTRNVLYTNNIKVEQQFIFSTLDSLGIKIQYFHSN